MVGRDHLETALDKLYLRGPTSQAESGDLTVSDVDAVVDSSVDRDIELLITDTYGIEPAKHRISLDSIYNEMNGGLCRTVLNAATSERSAEEIFKQEEKDKIFRRTIGRDLATYKILFPVSARVARVLGNEITVLERKISKLSEDETEKHLDKEITGGENEKLDFDDSAGERAEELFAKIDADIWQMEIGARDSVYALSQARSIVKYLFGKLSFLGLRWHSCTWSMGDEFSGDHPPGMREPPGYLTLIPTSAQETAEVVLHSKARNRVDSPTNLASPRLDGHDDLPALPALSDFGERDTDLYNAFRSYQNGISSRDTTTAFFAFWRGLENLCVDDNYSNAELVEHAEGVLRTFSGQKLGNPEYRTGYLETNLPRIVDVIDGIGDLRNRMVHSASKTEIQTHHVNAVRLLFEGYLEAYAEFYDIDANDEFESAILSLEPTMSERVAEMESHRKTIELLRKEIEFLEEAQDLDRTQNTKRVDNIKQLHRSDD